MAKNDKVATDATDDLSNAPVTTEAIEAVIATEKLRKCRVQISDESTIGNEKYILTKGEEVRIPQVAAMILASAGKVLILD